MTNCTVIDEGGYVGHCTASELAPGVWEAAVLFEQKSDLSHTFVRAMRHKLPAKFGSHDEAMQSAIAYGLERARTGDVGL